MLKKIMIHNNKCKPKEEITIAKDEIGNIVFYARKEINGETISEVIEEKEILEIMKK